MGCCAQDEHVNPAAGWLPKVFGILLALAGGYILLFGLPDPDRSPSLSWRKREVADRGSPGFDDPAPVGPADRVIRYRVSQGDRAELLLDVAEYRDPQQRPARAIVYRASGAGERSDGKLRHDLWEEAMAAIKQHAPADALFLGWWDNAQRIAYGSGRAVWAASPSRALYRDASQRSLWSEVSGGYADDDANLRQLARWLAMDADQALADMAQRFQGRQVYLLVCLDDLARLSEIEALAGSELAFEGRLFPAAENLHGQIAGVKRWTVERGTGNYLVQQLSSGDTRAWRIVTEAGARSLLARLLPFTSSLAKPLDRVSLVYQSAWGGYLSVYRVDFTNSAP
ncbi:MAG: hydroxylamine oxidation protein HaoB [Methylococcaceae bacterium]|nr:hydroxylamine oxidation protein HaoB [Methylococcaceae bacterium]